MKGLIVLLIILYIVFSFQKMRLYYANKEEKELVAWCVTDDSKSFRANLSLHDYIHNAQINENIPQEYRISTKYEWSITEDILQYFQAQLIQNYFQDKLLFFHSRYTILGEHYFMFELNDLLKRHLWSESTLFHNIHKETDSYSISDFTIVYHKLYFTSYSFCKNSKIINPKGNLYTNESRIKDLLEEESQRCANTKK